LALLPDFMSSAGHGDESEASLDSCGVGGHVDEVFLLDAFRRFSDEFGLAFLGGRHDVG
jgi:hypothetical protein